MTRRRAAPARESPTAAPADRRVSRRDRQHAPRRALPIRPRRRADPRQARVVQPRRQRQGPDRARDDRGRRAPRAAPAGRHDRRADVGQHRRRARDGRRGARLPLRHRHARGIRPGQGEAAWRGSAPRSCARPPTRYDRRGRASPRRSPPRLPAPSSPTSSHNPVNPAGPLRDDRARDRPRVGGPIDAWVAGVGTTGTFVGVARYPARARPGLLRVAVEPQGSILGGGAPGPHEVEGIGLSIWPESSTGRSSTR